MSDISVTLTSGPTIDVEIIGTGARGKEGKSAYEIWLDLGNEGTEQEYLASLKGQKGDKGDAGNPGSNGYTPVRGTDYWTAADITTMESYINSYVNTVILGGAS